MGDVRNLFAFAALLAVECVGPLQGLAVAGSDHQSKVSTLRKTLDLQKVFSKG